MIKVESEWHHGLQTIFQSKNIESLNTKNSKNDRRFVVTCPCLHVLNGVSAGCHIWVHISALIKSEPSYHLASEARRKAKRV